LACAARWPPPAEAFASVSLSRSPLARPPEQRAQDHEEPATVPTTSPPRAGFGRLFHSANPCKDEPHSADKASSTRCQSSVPRRDVSRRSLQSEQPTSTTTNHPSPDRGCRLGASSSRWTGRRPPGGVGAPTASSTDNFQASPRAQLDDRVTPWFPPSPGPGNPRSERRSPPDASRGFTSQGPSGKPAQPLPRYDTRRRRVRCAGIRTRERAFPKLDPLEHLLSRGRSDIGWMVRHR